MTFGELLRQGKLELEVVCPDEAGFEAAQLLVAAAGKIAASVGLASERMCAEDTEQAFRDYLRRRLSGEPLQYIVGEWDFYKYSFFCGEGVLIPRPETEELCERCVDFVKKNSVRLVLDLCAGTGCIGLSVALDCPGTEVTLCEKYDAALYWLRKNVVRHRPANVSVMKADVLTASSPEGLYGLIVSNPPYIESGEIASLQAEVRREPATALDGGADGLDFYRAIRENWLRALKPGGMLIVECGETQTEAVAGIFSPLECEIYKDSFGMPRMVAVYR